MRSLGELVRILTRRWGVQENVFKGLKGMGIDAISSYRAEAYPEDWLFEEAEEREVANPQLVILDERIGEVKREIRKRCEEVGGLASGGKKETSRRLKLLQEGIAKKKEILAQLKDEYAAAPAKVGITEIIKAKDTCPFGKRKEKVF